MKTNTEGMLKKAGKQIKKLNPKRLVTPNRPKTPFACKSELKHLDYFEGTIYEAIARSTTKYPDNLAYEFLGHKVNYRDFRQQIEDCAKAMCNVGIKQGDVVTIALPNCPQALIVFYAASLIGAVTSIIHPLSSEREIEYYLNLTKSVLVVTLNQFYDKFRNVFEKTSIRKVIVTGIDDGLGFPKNIGYKLYVSQKSPKIEKSDKVIGWHTFIHEGKKYSGKYFADCNPKDPALILFSGGTTGTTKGVVISSYAFNAFATQVLNSQPSFTPGDKFLAAMPLFHGFGLGVCVHSMLIDGASCVLIPRFTPKSYVKLISSSKCTYFAGVPTLFEAILRISDVQGLDFSNLKGVFSGGDSLSIDLKERFDKFLYANGSTVSIREGYGATETIAACCLTPFEGGKKGSIGFPYADTTFKIADLETNADLPNGEVGEILISGPSLMMEYINNPEETKKTILIDENGQRWLHTGDLGMIDEEGYVFFKGRAKRMIIASGYNVYPNQIEEVLNENSMIEKSCVIGIPDKYRMQKIKAYIVLSEGVPKTDDTKRIITDYCINNIARYAKPNEIEFRDSLPVTRLGKIDFRALEKENE